MLKPPAEPLSRFSYEATGVPLIGTTAFFPLPKEAVAVVRHCVVHFVANKLDKWREGRGEGGGDMGGPAATVVRQPQRHDGSAVTCVSRRKNLMH